MLRSAISLSPPPGAGGGWSAASATPTPAPPPGRLVRMGAQRSRPASARRRRLSRQVALPCTSCSGATLKGQTPSEARSHSRCRCIGHFPVTSGQRGLRMRMKGTDQINSWACPGLGFGWVLSGKAGMGSPRGRQAQSLLDSTIPGRNEENSTRRVGEEGL